MTPPFAALLLDIDGTLLRAGGAGRRAFERALAEHHGPVNGLVAAMRFDGMTDRGIVREALGHLGRPFDEGGCLALLARYVELLRDEVHGPGFRVLPGVPELLPALQARGVPYGLCTGNVAEGARVKLARAGLADRFDWSPRGMHGFAEDGEARHRVVAAAVRRVGEGLGRAVPASQVLIVGDTPRDVQAGHQVGCPVLCVATGNFDAAALRAAGADAVVETLEAPEARRLMGLA